MIFWIYNVLLVFLSPFWVPWMLWRASKRREKPNWKQRTGDLPIRPAPAGVRRVWIHAVSVGEVMATLPILRAIRSLDSSLEIVLSTTTSTGQEAAKKRAVDLYDHLVYFPIDVPRFVVAALARVRPNVVAVMETELWLNFFWTSHQFRAKNLVINARLSDKSQSRVGLAGAYYRALARMTDSVFAQTEGDAERFRALGFNSVVNNGNTKFDSAIEESQTDIDWHNELGIPKDAQVIVIGSTRSELEEQLVCSGLQKAGLLDNPTIWIIHAPRHIERATAILERYKSAGFKEPGLRSKGEKSRVLVLDTIGELGFVYSVADIAVVGGGFDELGGQNILQPLAHGVPVIHGPHMHNFRDACEGAMAAGATIVAKDSMELSNSLTTLLADQTVMTQMSANAKSYMSSHGGAALRCAEAIVKTSFSK